MGRRLQSLRAALLRRHYYATATTLQIKGWQWAEKNRDAAVGLAVKAYPNLDRADELVAADVMLSDSFDDGARVQGWGTMDPAVWAEQFALSPLTALM